MPPVSPRELVDAHERGRRAARRRRLGAHATPSGLAAGVVGAALGALGRTPSSVLDPSCGAGAMLLAAADALVERGVSPRDALRSLRGRDVDAGALAQARQVLAAWGACHGVPVDPAELDLSVADALAVGPVGGAGPATVDLVVGNPPFLGQLNGDTARDATARAAVAARFGRAAAYADAAALHLLAALETVRPGGVVAMVQPLSVLSAADSGWIRQRLLEGADLAGLWASDAMPFAAQVRVCVPVLRRHGARRARAGSPARVTLWWGEAWTASTVRAPGASSWAPLLAPALGVPTVPDTGAALVSSVAAATAGFRDHYYALCDALVESPDDTAPEVGPSEGGSREFGAPEGGSDPEHPASRRLVSVGMVDPLRVHDRARRIAGRPRERPTVDLEVLAARSPKVAAWVRARLVPKVLVATQTRVPEVAVDAAGELVPLTPLIAVEPLAASGPDEGARPLVDVWHLAAALSAPPVAARAAAQLAGSGRSATALRLSASSVGESPLPVEAELWDRGAALARRAVEDPARRDAWLRELGRVMTQAHALPADHPVVGWWIDNLPRRRT